MTPLRIDSRPYEESCINLLKEEFGSTQAVNKVLLGKRGVPPMPTLEEVISAVRRDLMHPTFEFIYNADAFGTRRFLFQQKLVAPSDRIDLLEALINEQPRSHAMGNLTMDAEMRAYLGDRISRVSAPTWYWEYVQGHDLYVDMRAPYQRDDSGPAAYEICANDCKTPIQVRIDAIDRYTWGTLIAAGRLGGDLSKNPSLVRRTPLGGEMSPDYKRKPGNAEIVPQWPLGDVHFGGPNPGPLVHSQFVRKGSHNLDFNVFFRYSFSGPVSR